MSSADASPSLEAPPVSLWPQARSWPTILKNAYKELDDDRVGIVAAGMAFYGMLALFPALAALASIYGLFAEPATLQGQLQMLADVVPPDVLKILEDELSRLASAKNAALGLGFAFGLGLSLWSANTGVRAMFDALNIVCEEDERRGFFKVNLLSLSFTLAAILFSVFSIGVVVVLPIALDVVGLRAGTEWAISLLRWPFLVAFVGALIAALYRYGPSRDRALWPWVTPGAIFASLLWLVAAVLFSWYVSNFDDYSKTYGSLGAVVGLLTWTWASAYIVLAGAELNSEIENHHTGRRMTSAIVEQEPFPPYVEAPASLAVSRD